jgi:hypothetical protein
VLRRIEEGRVDPPYSLILCLAEALETSPTYLITQPILLDAITPKLRPPPPGTPRLKARATWEAIREDIRALYAAGEHHRIIALELGLTRMQLQSQLHHLFREGMPKRWTSSDDLARTINNVRILLAENMSNTEIGH